jgi:hypothetical protein
MVFREPSRPLITAAIGTWLVVLVIYCNPWAMRRGHLVPSCNRGEDTLHFPCTAYRKISSTAYVQKSPQEIHRCNRGNFPQFEEAPFKVNFVRGMFQHGMRCIRHVGNVLAHNQVDDGTFANSSVPEK